MPELLHSYQVYCLAHSIVIYLLETVPDLYTLLASIFPAYSDLSGVAGLGTAWFKVKTVFAIKKDCIIYFTHSLIIGIGYG